MKQICTRVLEDTISMVARHQVFPDFAPTIEKGHPSKEQMRLLRAVEGATTKPIDEVTVAAQWRATENSTLCARKQTGLCGKRLITG